MPAWVACTSLEPTIPCAARTGGDGAARGPADVITTSPAAASGRRADGRVMDWQPLGPYRGQRPKFTSIIRLRAAPTLAYPHVSAGFRPRTV